MLQAEKGEFKQAEKRGIKALSSWKNHKKNSLGYCYALARMSHIYKKSKKYAEALKYAQEATSIYRSINGRSGWYFDFLSDEGLIHQSIGNMDSAYHRFVQIPKLVRNYTAFNCSFLSFQSKEIFSNQSNGIRNEMFTMLERLNNRYPDYNRKVFEFVNFYKGFSRKSLSGWKKKLEDSTDTLWMESYKKWISLREAYYHHIDLENFSPDTLTHYAQLIEELEINLNHQLNLKEADVIREYNMHWDLSQVLQKGESAIEFVRYKDAYTEEVKYGALIASWNWKTPVFVYLCLESELESLVERRYGETDFEMAERLYDCKGQLFHHIWEPVFSRLPEPIERVYASYAGLLFKMPHDAIVQASKYAYCDLSQLNSTGDIAQFKKRNKVGVPQKALLIGGVEYDDIQGVNGVLNGKRSSSRYWKYLQATEVEVRQLGEKLEGKGSDVELIMGENASEEQFKSKSDNRGVDLIHIATHAYSSCSIGDKHVLSNQMRYLKSGLVMAGANRQLTAEEKNTRGDGVLNAPEIINLDLSETELVVLSACESGLGQVSFTEEVYGLQRAFKIAGANFIIYTLWNIPDEYTMRFMLSFYDKLLTGQTISDALARTKKDIKNIPGFESAYYWGAFQLIY
jgi:CHAT domain-containing protein